MRAMYDYVCPICGPFERYTYYEDTPVQCDCGMVVHRVLSAARFIKVDGFPSGINGDQWAKTREQNARRVKERDG